MYGSIEIIIPLITTFGGVFVGYFLSNIDSNKVLIRERKYAYNELLSEILKVVDIISDYEVYMRHDFYHEYKEYYNNFLKKNNIILDNDYDNKIMQEVSKISKTILNEKINYYFIKLNNYDSNELKEKIGKISRFNPILKMKILTIEKVILGLQEEVNSFDVNMDLLITSITEDFSISEQITKIIKQESVSNLEIIREAVYESLVEIANLISIRTKKQIKKYLKSIQSYVTQDIDFSTQEKYLNKLFDIK